MNSDPSTSPTVEGGAPDRRSPILSSPNRLKLACFAQNCQRGTVPTLAEGSFTQLDWQTQIAIARAAENAGMEAVIPIARWRGYAGPSQYNRASYETIPWAAGLAAATSRIAVFSTLHAPLVHPVRAAKEMATIDHISNGRFAVNIVCGWNASEFDMFGLTQRAHDDRYAQGAEWAAFVKKLWSSEEPFDWNGTFYSAKGAISQPPPIQQRPVMMNAGASPAGRDFGAKHMDLCFAGALTLDDVRNAAQDIKARAERHGRSVQVWMYASLLCADSEAEVKRQYDHFVHEKGDWVAGEAALREIMAGGSRTLNLEPTSALIERMVAWFGAYQLMGTPPQIVEKMTELSEAGVDGLALTWLDYAKGIESYRQDILPLAISAGLRVR